MKNKKTFPIALKVFLLMPLLSSIIAFNSLPEKVPMHWNVYGQIDRYLPKFPGAFLIPLICILLLCFYMPSISKERFEKSPRAYTNIGIALSVLFFFMHFIVLGISLGAEFIKVDYVIKFAIGLLIMIIGNLMPKLRYESSITIKKPWLAGSQRHGGFVWFICGIILVSLAFIPGIISAVIYFSLIFFCAFEPMIYSYLRYRK